MVPLIADQFFNAAIGQRLRLGQVVARDRLAPARVRAAVEEVLSNRVYGENVGRLRAQMHALPDVQYGMRLVERVAAERRPVLNTDLETTRSGE
jgi:UDP:flavonoid glycosyltransferase YjiC (YdhE family)